MGGPGMEQLAARLGEVESRLHYMHMLATHAYDMGVAGEWRALLAQPRYGEPGRLERHGYKVWSQNDEDGILAEIFGRIGTGARTFVEFGVTDGRECNTLKLLVEGWRGLWMESSAQHCAEVRRIFAAALAEGRLELKETSVTAENIGALLAGSRAGAGELDLLSIDIDGNDYHVLAAIRDLRARVLVIEYNSKFPPPMDVVPPYEPSRVWDGSDYGGASLQAIAGLAARRGYRLVGTNITGVNAFFVRADLAGAHFAPPDIEALYNPPRLWLTPGFVAGSPARERFDYTSDGALAERAP
ncbi:MAG TPA: FkbM family methyltransferase [Burkholderiales bacterium]|nr:FkbM family methyltransferase [Burkholderiales bacterium]